VTKAKVGKGEDLILVFDLFCSRILIQDLIPVFLLTKLFRLFVLCFVFVLLCCCDVFLSVSLVVF
jgi:hypothetical protein